MSLLYFHILLITSASLFALFFGYSEYSLFQTTGNAVDLWTSLGSFAVGAGLLIYLIWFIKKKLPLMRR